MRVDEAIRYASTKGYRVLDDGSPVSPSGRILKTNMRGGYLYFGVRRYPETTTGVPVHRLMAYQKYGDSALADGIESRHKNGDSTNNSVDNILIGSRSDNCLDIEPERRIAIARNAASYRRSLPDHQVILLREKRAAGATYEELMYEFDISKSTVSFICNRKTYKHIAG